MISSKMLQGADAQESLERARDVAQEKTGATVDNLNAPIA